MGARNMVQWDGFARFTAQLAAWLVPPVEEEGLAAQVSQQEQGSLLRLIVTDPQGNPSIISMPRRWSSFQI